MLISDWSSDVCSSDLCDGKDTPLRSCAGRSAVQMPELQNRLPGLFPIRQEAGNALFGQHMVEQRLDDGGRRGDRKSGVSGRSVAVRVDFGGRRVVKKKMKQE